MLRQMAIHGTILVLLSILLVSSSSSTGVATSTDNAFIQASCAKATYPGLCMTSLSAFASTIHSSPIMLVNTAISVSLSKANDTSLVLTKLARMSQMDHRASQAMRDCIENMGYSITQLGKAIAEMGQLRGKQLRFRIHNVQTWVSAALADDETCLDSFSEKIVDGKMKDEVRARIVKVAKLTSNALSLINVFLLR